VGNLRPRRHRTNVVACTWRNEEHAESHNNIRSNRTGRAHPFPHASSDPDNHRLFLSRTSSSVDPTEFPSWIHATVNEANRALTFLLAPLQQHVRSLSRYIRMMSFRVELRINNFHTCRNHVNQKHS